MSEAYLCMVYVTACKSRMAARIPLYFGWLFYLRHDGPRKYGIYRVTTAQSLFLAMRHIGMQIMLRRELDLQSISHSNSIRFLPLETQVPLDNGAASYASYYSDFRFERDRTR
jgi:hypothetical protein